MRAQEKILLGLITATGAGLVAQSVVKDSEGLVSVTVPGFITAGVGVPTYVVGLTDGGRMYLANKADGGMGRVSVGGCVRRSAGGSAALCRRKDPDNALDLVGLNVGPLNRFPASEARPVVNDCEAVSCAIWQGEEANAQEDEIVNQLVGELIP